MIELFFAVGCCYSMSFFLGVMRISNLEFLFRSTSFQPEDVRQYISSLLAKFEVALQFDDQHLILPSLLPVKHELGSRRQADTKVIKKKFI